MSFIYYNDKKVMEIQGSKVKNNVASLKLMKVTRKKERQDVVLI